VIRHFSPLVKELGETRLSEITPGQIKALAKRLYPHYKPQSLNTAVIAPCAAAINGAHQQGLCGPIRIKRFAVKDERIARPIDREWIDAFMANASPHLAAFALFQFTTGARTNEACKLRPQDVDLDQARAEGPTKNGRRRPYYLTPEMVSRLRCLPPVMIQHGNSAGEWRVFGYASRGSIRQAWIKTCKAAGLDYRTCYEAGRHSHFTESISRQGTDIPTACKIGHITPAVALRRYAHAEKAEQKAMEVFGTKQTQRNRGKLKTVGKS
jgi:integrase